MAEARYEFGENWSRFLAGVGEERIAAASAELGRLLGVGPGGLAGKRFLDIGSGSGLHSLAALRLGAARVEAIDYDPLSVAATTRLLSHFAPNGPWSARQGDILVPEGLAGADIVYSWGVLHHTGDMWRAVENASALCRPGGVLALALYVKTPFCPFWEAEKRLYTRLKPLRPLADGLLAGLVLLRRALAGESPARHLREYKARRGMDFMTDIRDWLGGTPYESVADAELDAFLGARGFSPVRKRNVAPGLGLLGTGCGEWVYRRG